MQSAFTLIQRFDYPTVSSANFVFCFICWFFFFFLGLFLAYSLPANKLFVPYTPIHNCWQRGSSKWVIVSQVHTTVVELKFMYCNRKLTLSSKTNCYLRQNQLSLECYSFTNTCKRNKESLHVELKWLCQFWPRTCHRALLNVIWCI